MKRLWIVPVVLLSTLSNASQQPPIATTASKIIWEQPAQDLATAQGFTYKWYLDGSVTGTPFPSVLCQGTGVSFQCQAQFPAVTQGNHVMRITSSNVSQESDASDPFAFSFVGKPEKPLNLHIGG